MKRCHHKVLDLVDDSIGAHIAVEYPERCTACGDCVTVCKFNALELIDRSNKRNNR
ncbi:4Fe-4S binding protein [Bacteroides cellulosilyticus]|nr:4Fe-4S binding protein [Bacteroides cellulosilyticus]